MHLGVHSAEFSTISVWLSIDIDSETGFQYQFLKLKNKLALNFATIYLNNSKIGHLSSFSMDFFLKENIFKPSFPKKKNHFLFLNINLEEIQNVTAIE